MDRAGRVPEQAGLKMDADEVREYYESWESTKQKLEKQKVQQAEKHKKTDSKKVNSTCSHGKVDEIKDRLDIVDVIGRDITLHHKGGGEYTGATSSTSKSGSSLKVDQKLQLFKNFADGAKGDVLDWIGYNAGYSDTRGADFPEVLKIAADMAGVELEEATEEERNAAKEKADIQNLFTGAADIYHTNLKPVHYDYIKEKWGITEETVDKFKIGYATTGRDLKALDKETLKKSGLVYVNGGMTGGEVFTGRIIFPYWKNGKVVYLIGRETEETPKKKDGKETSKYQKLLVHKEDRDYVSPSVQNSYFYGEDSLRGSDYCIITEGVADCIAMLQADFPCISPVTVQFREKDHPKLLSLTKGLKRVYVCNDNEVNHAGLKGALSTAEALESAGIEARLIELPKPEGIDKIDIADYLKENSPYDFQELIDSSVRLWDFKLNQQVIQASSTSTERFRAFKSFVSNDLHSMQLDEWKIFVYCEVRLKFNLDKKDVKATIEEIGKNRQNDNKNETGESEEETHEDEGEGKARDELPILEERLNSYTDEIIRKANDILDNGDPFIFICDTWNELHVGDRNLGEMLACSIASTQVLNLAVGLHEKPSDDTESGKSDACSKMGKLCPVWKFRATTFSPKVLYYMPNLLPGTIIYTDDVDLEKPDVISTIKKVTGEFEDPTIADTIIDGKAVTMIIPPRINFWMSSVDTIGDKQLGTRFVYSNTTGGAEHDREVNHKQRGKALGKPLEDDNEKILICRCMFEYICDQLHYVFSPYLFASIWSAESEKRNLEKFISVLFAVTVFKYRQRETIHDCLVGTLEDWERAISVYSPVAQNNSCLLSDEEISILYIISEMSEAYDDGVPHKRLLSYMKEIGKFNKSDSTLKRILIGDIGSGKQGFKEKVPGFSYETISKPKLDEKGFEINGSGYTKTLCYSYDGALFDGIQKDADIVETIKKGIFVISDNYTAEGVEKLFRLDPVKVYSLKESTIIIKNWKGCLRNQIPPSEIIRNHQNSKPLNSELSSQPLTNNNNIIYNNNLRNQENDNNGGVDISVCAADGRIDEETHAKMKVEFPPENMNSENSEPAACDHALDFSAPVLNSEPAACDHGLNSELSGQPLTNNNDIICNNNLRNQKMEDIEDIAAAKNNSSSEIKDPINHVDSEIVSLLKRALIKFAWDEYNGTVPDIDEFIRMFNNKIPEYKKALGMVAVGFNSNKLHMRGWR